LLVEKKLLTSKRPKQLVSDDVITIYKEISKMAAIMIAIRDYNFLAK